MQENNKTIRDPIHGDIKLEGIFLDLIESPEIQRLHNIKQLGFAHLVFPGAHHTRLEHSLGAYFMASKAAESLDLEESEKELISISAFLHDIGHGPFSHTLESILRDALDVDHVDLTEKLVLGDHAIFDEKEKDIILTQGVFDILHKHGIDNHKVADIIKSRYKEKEYFNQLLNSSVDVDQLDYLIRDAYYTGVSYGIIDIDRFLNTLIIHDDKLMINKKGIGTVENILMARSLMYSSVYYHKTVRIAELMLSKAIELLKDKDPFELFKMTDGELLNFLKSCGGYQYEIGTRLKFRRLFKQAYSVSIKDLEENQIELVKELNNLEKRREKEIELEEKLGIPKGKIIIDVPYTELHLSEPRIELTNTLVYENEQIKELDYFSPLGEAIKHRDIPEWVIMIAVDNKYRDKVSSKAKDILFN